MKKLILILALLSLFTNCKKETISHLYSNGSLVVFYDILTPDNIKYPLTVTGIYYPAKGNDPNFYYVEDRNGVKYKNVADYNLRPYTNQ